MARWRNWGRTQSCRPARIVEPRDEAEIVAALAEAARAGAMVRVAGSGHSFSDLVPTDGWMMSLRRMNRVLEVDETERTITVEAGMTLDRLNREAARHGLALSNLGDVAYQSVAGAIATATHGTGARLGTLSTFVRSLRMVLAGGEIVDCSLENDATVFRAAQVGLGALGVVSAVRFRCEPAFTLHAVERPASLEDTLARLDELVDGNDHFEFFWFPHTDRVLTKANNRTDRPARPRPPLRAWTEDVLIENRVFGAVVTVGRMYPFLVPRLNRLVGRMLTPSEGVDRSDRVFASRRMVRFREMEYAVPRNAAAEAVRSVLTEIDRKALRVNFPVEVRFAAGDDALLSPAYGRDTAYIAVHQGLGLPWRPYFALVERAMTALGGRPHWGKMHSLDAARLRDRYPMWDEFAAVRRRLDPEGRFRSPAIDRLLGWDGPDG